MSQIINAIPPDALLPVAGAMVGWVGHMLWFRSERAHVAAGMARIRQFMRGNDEWLTSQQQRHAVEPKPVDAEVLHVEHATGPLPAITAEPEVTADDLAPLGPKDGWRAPWWSPLAIAAAVLAVAVLLPFWALWLAGEWAVGKAQRVAAAWRRRRDERYLIGSGEQATDVDPFAELLAHATSAPVDGTREVLAASGYELDIADEDELDEQRAAWVEANPPVNPPYKSHRCPHGAVSERDPGYRSRHTAAGYETGIFPAINPSIPAQRTEAE